ncbi:MAG: hypothetical protein NUV74_05555 [Candidatus Brocadiaceae bacterium]|nr:hypothetical protein [Candidatus Brocadiaceae bacterium]
MKRYSSSTNKGCPTCDGIDPASCMRCHGKTKLREWITTETGYAHITQLSQSELTEFFSNPDNG